MMMIKAIKFLTVLVISLPLPVNAETVDDNGMGEIDVQSSWNGDREEVPTHKKKNTGFRE